MSKRAYDFVLLGATGYTGKLTAEYITTSLPTNIKWAIAGRSSAKLESLVSTLKSLNADRTQPDTLTVDLTKPDLDSLAKKTRILLNCVGPFYLYSTPVVEACASAGTHYLDVTGETPWVREIITKYEKTAKTKSAIMIPEIGSESAPSDLIAYTATALVREIWECGVSDMVASVHTLKSSGPSGGTLATGLGLMDHYSMSTMKEAMGNPFVLSDAALHPEPTTYERTALQKATGVWEYPDLGTLTTSITAKPNVAIVHRSAGLTPLFYGFNFTYEEYMRVGGFLTGFLIHIALVLTTLLLAFPPIRMIAKKLATAPGMGPTQESSMNDIVEYRGIAVAEQLAKKPRKALSTFRYEGGLYKLTAVLLAEGAMVLLENADDVIKRHGAGFLTPSCLGDVYVERLKKAGVKISVKQMGDIGSK